MNLFLYLSLLISVFQTVFSSHLWYVQDPNTQVRCILLKATITVGGTNFDQARVPFSSKCGKQKQIMEIVKTQKSNHMSYVLRLTFTKNGKEVKLGRVDFEIKTYGVIQASTSMSGGQLSDFHFRLGTSLTTKQTIELTAGMISISISIKIKDIQVEAFRTAKDSKFDNAASSLMISMNMLLAVMIYHIIF
ncbi:Uncharacterised protein g3847 [Pycnogonum litorale]